MKTNGIVIEKTGCFSMPKSISTNPPNKLIIRKDVPSALPVKPPVKTINKK